MSALLTSSLGLSSLSGDNNHANIGNANVRIFITAVTITTLVILLTEMVIFSRPQFRNVLVFSRHFMWRRLLSVKYYQRPNRLPDFHDLRCRRSSQKCVEQAWVSWRAFGDGHTFLKCVICLLSVISVLAELGEIRCVCMCIHICVCIYIYIYTHIHAYIWGTAVAQCLRCCATNRKVAGSIPAGVIGIFHWHKILPIALWPWDRLSL